MNVSWADMVENDQVIDGDDDDYYENKYLQDNTSTDQSNKPLLSKNQQKRQNAIEFNEKNKNESIKMCLKCYKIKNIKSFKEFNRCRYCRLKQNVNNKKRKNSQSNK
jgi:hypothetical protein